MVTYWGFNIHISDTARTLSLVIFDCKGHRKICVVHASVPNWWDEHYSYWGKSFQLYSKVFLVSFLLILELMNKGANNSKQVLMLCKTSWGRRELTFIRYIVSSCLMDLDYTGNQSCDDPSNLHMFQTGCFASHKQIISQPAQSKLIHSTFDKQMMQL